MNRYLNNFWFRHAVLLGALAAGAVLTQIMPTYEEMAALHKEPVRPSAASRVRDHASTGVTGIEVDVRHLNIVERIS
jgi:hypothetical protein